MKTYPLTTPMSFACPRCGADFVFGEYEATDGEATAIMSGEAITAGPARCLACGSDLRIRLCISAFAEAERRPVRLVRADGGQS